MAATEVGRLIVELEARVGRLEAGLRRGQNSIRSFERRSTGAFSRIGRAFRRLAFRFTGITALIAAGAGAFSAVAFVRGAIDAASAVDGFEIRLRTLIGSQEGAAASLARLTVRAQKVAPQLRDIIEAAATLGTVALGSASGIERLTDTALNISAVTGLTLEQSSQNLQRALSAGFGAADLFRERGVRALVESLTNSTNLIEADFDTVQAKIDEVFGPGGIFGVAADQFAQTLPGAISRSRDALFNLSAAFGEALSPVIIATLNEVIIPAFNKLQLAIGENQEKIRDLAFRGVKAGILAFVEFGRVLIKFVEIVSRTGQFFRATAELILRGSRALIQVSPTFLLAKALPGEQDAERQVREITSQIKFLGEEGIRAERELGALDSTLDGLGEALTIIEKLTLDFGKASADAAVESEKAAVAALARARGLLEAATRAADPRVLREVEAASRSLDAILNTAARSAAKSTSEFAKQRIELDQEELKIQRLLAQQGQIVAQTSRRVEVQRRIVDATRNAVDKERESLRLQGELRALGEANAVVADTRARAERRLAEIAQERIDNDKEELRVKKSVRVTIGDIQAVAERIAILDAEKSQELTRQAFAILTQNLALEDQEKQLTDLLEGGLKTLDELEDALVTFGDVFSESITGALRTVFDNLMDPAVSFAETLADVSATLLNDAIDSALTNLQKGLQEMLQDVDLGPGFGQALVGALGIGVGLVSRALQGTETEIGGQTAKSVVDNVQEVRGVVAGPTQIGIAQVGETIETAFIETNGILREGNAILRRMLTALGGNARGLEAADVITDAGSTLGATAPSLP